MRIAGKVSWFSPSRGFGFITPDGPDQKDCFVHLTALQTAGVGTLIEGERVEFDVVQGIKGPAAENLSRPPTATLAGEG
jgi:CspA family cold shock protein